MHRGKTLVVGVPGEAIAAGKLPNIVQDLTLIHSMGLKIILVYGFRPQVNEQLALKGQQPRYHKGVRITDAVALDCVLEAAGQLRYEVEAAFSQALPNTPMAGATVKVVSGNFVTARPMGIVDGVDYHHSGLVRKVDVTLIQQLLDQENHRATFAAGFFAHGRGVQPQHGERGHSHCQRTARRQADLCGRSAWHS